MTFLNGSESGVRVFRFVSVYIFRTKTGRAHQSQASSSRCVVTLANWPDLKK